MESIHLTFAWSSIEPNAGNFDANYINNILDIADIYYPAYGTKVELQIPTMNTNVKVTPTDLVSTDFDDLTMINRFKGLIRVIDIGNSTTHTCAKISSYCPEYYRCSSGHILTTMVSNTLYYSYSS